MTLEDLKLLVYHDLNNTYLNQDRYTNEIEIVSLDGYDFTDEYAFILGFNQGVFPKLLKDEDYINDSIIRELYNPLHQGGENSCLDYKLEG